MHVTAYGQGSREKTRTSKAMGLSDTQVTTSQNLAFSVTVKDDKKTTPPIDPARSSKDGKISSRASSAKRKNQEQLATSVQWYIADTIEAARTATYLIADAEAKSFLVAEAVKKCEEEDVAERADEEMEVQLQLAMEIYERCASAELVVVELPGKDESKGRYEIYSSKMNND